MFLILVLVVCGSRTPCPAQLAGTKEEILDDVDRMSLNYTLQYAEMDRYLVNVLGTGETHDPKSTCIDDFEYVFAYSKGKTKADDRERVEQNQTVLCNSGNKVKDTRRELTVRDHLWVGSASADVWDELAIPMEQRRWSNYTWDPFAMPLENWGVLSVARKNYRDVVNYQMPSGWLFKGEIDEFKRRIGYWHHGRNKDLGYVRIIFDPRVGGMPVEKRSRAFEPPSSRELNPENPTVGTCLHELNETKWYRHPNGKYLPKEVACWRFYRDGRVSGWKMEMEWWLDEEVPEAVFELEDFRKSRTRNSIVNELIEKRISEGGTVAIKLD
jgi:hypothetical protein